MISIIALLIAILLPALAAARESANSIRCLSNERQLGLAFAMYTGDFSDTFSPFDLGRWDSTRGPWSGEFFVMGYFSTAKLYDCPTLKQTGINWANNAGWTALTNAFDFVEYGYNGDFLGSSTRLLGASDPARYSPAHIGDLTNPSGTITLVESLRFDFIAAGTYRGYYTVHPHANSGTGYLAHARHGSAVNTLWADGHASALAMTDQKDPYNTGLTNYSDPGGSYWDRK